jgi:glycosyl transferase family 25
MSASQVFVIHLARATARRENAEALLSGCGMDGEIWPAVDGAAMAEAEREGLIGDGLFAPRYPFALKPGELGCFLSHRTIWEEILKRGLDWALVLEDDAALDPDMYPAALRLAAAHVRDLGYIQLQNRPPKPPFHHIATDGACVLGQATLTPLRTTAQAVSRAAAERLLSLSDRIDRPVDSFLQSHWHTGLRLGTIYPSGISSVDVALAGSTIQGGTRSLSQTLSREWRRFRYRGQVARAARDSGAPEVKP